MKKRALVFFPHNPWPPRTGAHKRCLEMLGGLKEVGCTVTLASSTYSSHIEWEASSVHHLENGLAVDVRVYRATAADLWPARLVRKSSLLYHRFKQASKRIFPITVGDPPSGPSGALPYTTPGMRRWFRNVVDEVDPDVVLMSYMYWDGLLDHERFSSTLRVVDTIDLYSLSLKMQQALAERLPEPLSAAKVDDQILQEDFFERLNLAAIPEEFSTFDRYDYAIAISRKEADLIKQNTHETEVVFMPMTLEPRYIPNRYSGPALFSVGPHPFNLQGYLYFVKRVLPLVRERAPGFSLQVTGSFFNNLCPEPEEGVVLSGFVPDLVPIFELSRFVVCPILGGTGQAVKIVEAMAHGVPVIALRAIAATSPIQHGVNGLVADSAEEFADHVVRLWNDENLCRKLGNAARDTIATRFSRTRLLDTLSSMIGLR